MLNGFFNTCLSLEEVDGIQNIINSNESFINCPKMEFVQGHWTDALLKASLDWAINKLSKSKFTQQEKSKLLLELKKDLASSIDACKNM